MERRELGKSGIKVSPVMFGAWAIGGTFWGGSDDRLAVDAIRAGIDAGITALDTAAIYGMGRSERVVGEAIKGRRDEVVVATKCGQRWDREVGMYEFSISDEFGTHYDVYLSLKADSIREECDASLQRLGVDCIDLYQIHCWDRFTPADDFLEVLVRLREEGKIRAIGMSGLPIDVFRRCAELDAVDVLQLRYNLLDRNAEATMLPLAARHGVSVIVYSPLERGLLTGTITADRTFAEGDQRNKGGFFGAENRALILEALECIRPLTVKYNASFAQLAAAWTFSRPGIAAAIVGARKPEQSRENAGAMAVQFTPEDIDLMSETFVEPARIMWERSRIEWEKHKKEKMRKKV